ncbi:cytochrome c oxidase assembly protein [Paraburkholderia oxyphila]|uniref:cytochrome c oxidase assembly protein n=1 Tax=Paraburkholderia oxyphila TaxID=614212 RepID=UPI0005BCBBD9|nr:cytochrome c oxidase assembly protein [Paraburkholderia oxyphila]
MSGSWNSSAPWLWLVASATIAVTSVSAAVLRRWSAWHALSGVAAGVLIGAAASSLRNPLSSMASYTAALMVLNLWVPPLLLASVPASTWASWRGVPAPAAARGLAGWLLDPWVAASVFVLLSVMVSLPGIFEPALVNALFSAPLGIAELCSGLLFWCQLFRCLRAIRHDWQAGLFVLLGTMPMMAVAVVWMFSQNVLYMPYLNVICQWNVPPLVDQHWAGFVMLFAGLPLQIVGMWRLAGLGSVQRAAAG